MEKAFVVKAYTRFIHFELDKSQMIIGKIRWVNGGKFGRSDKNLHSKEIELSPSADIPKWVTFFLIS